MKVGLINPRGALFSKNASLMEFMRDSTAMGSFRHFWSAPCLGLLSIASYFPSGWELAYIDENYLPIDFSQNYDVVCISAMTVQATRAYEIARVFRDRGVLTVLGGIHATICTEEALSHFDVVLAGEGELLAPAFVQDLIDGSHQRLYQNQSGYIFDLHDCITPRYDLIRGYDYPVINLYTTRGCPRKCYFCCASNVYGTRYRRKSNSQIMTELNYIAKEYPDRLVLFADDNLFVKKSESMQMLREMEEKNIAWIAQADIAIADDASMLRLMREAGCKWVVIGFESVTKEGLAGLEGVSFKRKYVKSYREKIARIQSYGIEVYGTFIVGLDNDDLSVFDKTAEFILSAGLYGVNITVPTPLPGTALRLMLEEEGRILSNRWDEYTLWDVVVRPRNMSVAQLESGLLSLYRTIAHADSADRRLRDMHARMRENRKREIG